MSSDAIKVGLSNFSTNFFLKDKISSKTLKSKKLYTNSLLKARMLNDNNNIEIESVINSMLRIIIENRSQSNFIKSILSINSMDLDLDQELNICKKIISLIPFSFQYDKVQTKFLFNFFQLEDKDNLTKKTEFNK